MESNNNIQVIGISKGKLKSINTEKIESNDMDLYATKSDLLKLQATINEHLINQNSLLKKEMRDIKKMIAPVNESLETFEQHMIRTNEQLIKLYESSLLNEENVTKMKSRQKGCEDKCKINCDAIKILKADIMDLRKGINDNKSLVSSNNDSIVMDEMFTLKKELESMKEDYHQTKKSLDWDAESQSDILQNITNKLSALRLLCQDIETETKILTTSSDKNKVQITQLNAKLEKATNMVTNQHAGTGSANNHKDISYVDVVVKEDILLLVDSNGAKIDENKLSRDHSCKKVFTPTWTHVKDFLEVINTEFLGNVKQIWVHVGTNDTDNNDPLKVIQIMEINLALIKRTFPEAEIFISKIIPRKSMKFLQCIDDINKFLASYCRQHDLSLFKYKADANMLDDEKHLNRKGFQIMLGALKYVLFDIVPQRPAYDKKPNYRDNRNRRHP